MLPIEKRIAIYTKQLEIAKTRMLNSSGITRLEYQADCLRITRHLHTLYAKLNARPGFEIKAAGHTPA
ncbi:MAG: hypothetical protein J6Y20_07520 [Lachnospiraceae bacterium]|nr:hypothetical protein [Lachnospiraceae bacterium]